MTERGILQYKSSGSLLWSTPLALMVAVPGALLAAVAIIVGNTWHAGRTPCLVVGVIGGSAVLVAVACRIESAVYTRGETMVFPDHQVGHHARSLDARDRVIIHRRTGAGFYLWIAMVGLWTATITIVLLDTTDYGTAGRTPMIGVLILSCATLVWMVVSVLVARFVVTPEYFQVDTLFRSTRVPRHLIGSFERDSTDLRLNLTDAGRVTFRVDSPIADYATRLPYRHNRRAQVRTIERLLAALSAVPDRSLAGAKITARWRRSSVVMVAVLASTCLVGAVVTAVTFNSLPQ